MQSVVISAWLHLMTENSGVKMQVSLHTKMLIDDSSYKVKIFIANKGRYVPWSLWPWQIAVRCCRFLG